MCFIKSYCQGSHILYNTFNQVAEQLIVPIQYKPTPSLPVSLAVCGGYPTSNNFCTGQYSLLPSLLASVMANSQLIFKMQSNIEATENKLDQTVEMIAEKEKQIMNQSNELAAKCWNSKQPITRKIFGEKQYKYKLKLRNKFPMTIYKERNMMINIELVCENGKHIMNSNLINLCVSACQTTGEWIPENEQGQYFIQGKTEVQLYHGQSQFLKVYARDVSRSYENGKINLIIYPKQSLIQFSTYSWCVQQMVKTQQIEPLLIKDITIRAKKKPTH